MTYEEPSDEASRWRADAAAYDASFDQPWGRYASSIEHDVLLDAIGPVAGLDVCDAGCGTGRFTARLEAEGARVVGVDTDRLLEDNLGRFREKWGDAEAAGYAPARPRVSLTMIVRDEEANLPDCLAGLRELFDEIVVVDTGSLDRTREAAAAHGARVVEFPWVDDFAAARNEGLRPMMHAHR